MLNLTPISLPYTVSTDTEEKIGLPDTTFCQGESTPAQPLTQTTDPTYHRLR